MLEMMKKPLELQKIQSTIIALKEIPAEQETLEKCLADNISGEATVVIWLMQKIVWGTWQNGSLNLTDTEEAEPLYWLELRAFNSQEELHLTKDGDSFFGRLRKDGTGSGCYCTDCAAPIFGEKIATDGKNIVLEDSARKISLEIPVKDSAGKKYGLVTRNYVGEDKMTGLSGYEDYRFLAVEVLEV